MIGSLLSGALGFGVTLGRLTIPKLGPAGVALGFVVESILTASFFGLYVALNKEMREFEFFSNMLRKIKNHGSDLKDILKLGGSISFNVAIELAMTLAVGMFSGLVGVTQQSAMTFNMQFIYFEFIALAAFSFSCAQEVSRALGAKQIAAAKNISKYGLITTMIYLTPIPILFALAPQLLEIISGNSNSDISSILKTLVPIMSIGVILDALRYNLLQQSRAFNDLLVPNLIAVFGMLSGIALSGVLGLKTSLGIEGVGLGFMVGVGITAFGLLIRWIQQQKKLEIPSFADNKHLLFNRVQPRIEEINSENDMSLTAHL